MSTRPRFDWHNAQNAPTPKCVVFTTDADRAQDEEIAQCTDETWAIRITEALNQCLSAAITRTEVIDISVHDSSTDIGSYHLGSVTPPDHLLADSRAKDGQRFWHAVLNGLWSEWREAVPEPSHDGEFIEWLANAKGWEARESGYHVTIET